MAIAIKVENLSKIYRLGEIGTGTISRDIERFVKTKILKQEDPFLKIGETNDRAVKGASNIVYSLKDINFEIEQGDAVGIIGRNGAGKSTLLKILSRVTSPTTGKINIKGRVVSLLEVGTGFHPELTGSENIYLNGAILGMRKREIDRKLDEIIDFSGVERYIDTPVKRYSSGMYVRLAFAVAAHLESEILIVDEVLAVGDAEFQKKCLGKMGEVSKGEGRTVLFVSHNMAAVRKLCNTGILLDNGSVNINDNMEKVFLAYHNSQRSFRFTDYNLREGNGEIRLSKIDLVSPEPLPCGGNLKFVLTLNNKILCTELIVSITIRDLEYNLLSYIVSDEARVHYINKDAQIDEIIIQLNELRLRPGNYSLRVILSKFDTRMENTLDIIENALEFEIEDNYFFSSEKPIRTHDKSPLFYGEFNFR
jgi:lipopolysaccharide transport system ATP-binding protein